MSSDAPGLSRPADPAESDADRVVAAVVGVPGVHALHGGGHGEIATYLPGRRVTGVRLLEPGCEVHVVLAWGAAIGPTTDLVRAAVGELTGTPVHVVVADVAPPESGTTAIA